MMEKIGFPVAVIAGFFTVFLLVWHGYNGSATDWVYGFLAVFWSLIMMLRIITLTEPVSQDGPPVTLAQKIIASLRARQDEEREAILQKSLGGSFAAFVCAGLFFSTWQILCAEFPSNGAVLESLQGFWDKFFIQGSIDFSTRAVALFDWGQGFLLFLSFAMMAFVFRSYAMDAKKTRVALLVLAGYAISGYIAFAGLDSAGLGGAVDEAAFVGNGAGAFSYLLSTLSPDHKPSLFDMMLIESGIGGIAILTLILFIPLGSISLSVQAGRTDWMIVVCGVIMGLALVFGVFLPFTPALGGFVALCWMGLFLAWGAGETMDFAKTDLRRD